ncbi:MAG: macrocin O-methyltransferase [Actinobacteria bacterium]|nr:MAG: macrocin O-methyltransferase [Actinomycetota bacterium]
MNQGGDTTDSGSQVAAGSRSPESLYLELLKRCLTRDGFEDPTTPFVPNRQWKRTLWRPVERRLSGRGLKVVRPVSVDDRRDGRIWPTTAETMVGLSRLDNLQHCIETVVADEVAGDLLEAGAWRGGASIFMRAVLATLGDTRRTVWVADSFEGLPRPDASYTADEGDEHWTYSELAVSVEVVKANFAKYGFLDDQVRFLPGWFEETLPNAPISALAVLRLDGDMYSSTMQSLDALYPKLSEGGFAIIDDYGNLEPCRQAVDDYRAAHGIREPIERIDWTGVYWRRH